MKRILMVMAVLAWMSTQLVSAKDSRGTSFNNDWQFALQPIGERNDTPPGGEWRTLNLPHDWAIEGDFSPENPSGTGGGALPGGTGWYRKEFELPKSDTGKQVYIDFDGAYMNTTVWVNGHELGTRPYGYSSFSYDMTPWLNFGGRNEILVRVDNSDQPNSRWYSGCGIYRNVWLRKVEKVHIEDVFNYWKEGEVTIQTKVVIGEKGVDPQVRSRIENEQGVVVASSSPAPVNLEDSTITQKLAMRRYTPWTLENPYMYTVVTETLVDGKVTDTLKTPLGIRTFTFDPERGFSLNGKEMKINGVCLHHDAGALGAVVNRRAIERQLEILKGMGVNAIRSSHNPPAPELLELTDSMGFIVMDEAFDMWRRRKTPRDYARFFDEWHERDLTDLVVRDRNHPSVMMWSIGNEVLEQWSDASADTLSLEEANMILNFGQSAEMLAKEGEEMSVNSLLTKKLADLVRSLDPTRPVTAGNNEPSPGNHLFRSGALDIIGYNYHDEWFKDVPTNFPDMPFIITESVSALQTRGYYDIPADSIVLAPERWDRPYYDPSFSASAYDNMRAPWGNHHEGTLRHVVDNDFISGQFIWTGWDYIGEPTPYGWPARSSYFGIVDLAGFPKDVYYMYKSEWMPEDTVLHVFPHWNHEIGDTVDIWAYYNNADEVELFLNGESLGSRSKADTDGKFHVAWRVGYEPGELVAISRKINPDGTKSEVTRKRTVTTGEATGIRLTPDRRLLKADGTDLSYITVEVTDENGNVVPTADNQIEFTVNGAGFIAGVDNGSPISLERFKDTKRKLFNGKALLIVQNNGEPGAIHITATGEGLDSTAITIDSK
ncbi:MAG: DUF4982 domain-containing protein [Muribaculaceae bacterium]|nr:DUF4982 domain-containing protein [Muribaculaceae bacterium]